MTSLKQDIGEQIGTEQYWLLRTEAGGNDETVVDINEGNNAAGAPVID